MPVKSTCFLTGSTSSVSTDVVHQLNDEGRVTYVDRSLTEPVMAPTSPVVDLHRITGDSELTKLPVNLKLNGVVQLDEGPLDLSVSRCDAVTRSRRSDADNKQTSSRLRSLKSQSSTSGSLATLVKRFGIISTSTTTSTSGTSSVIGSGGGGRSSSRISHDASPLESSTRPRSVTAPQSTSLFSPLLTPGSLLNSSEWPATTFGSPPPPSRWRRDSFWANGGWLAGATAASSSSSLVAERFDNRKRPQSAATSDSGGVERRPHVVDAQSIKLNRKLVSDHRKSSQRSSTRPPCDRNSSSSGHYSSRASKMPAARPREANRASCVDGVVTMQPKDSTATSPKLPRMDDSQDNTVMTLHSEAADTEKKKRQDADDGGDVSAATPLAVRSNLTSLRCGSCSAQFESLYCLTVHLEETGHKPASDVAVLPIPSPATSPSSTDRKPTVASPTGNATTPPASAPQRLVRGQDVWLARGVEQTDRILRCIQCNAPARSLAELTLHMVHTKHYINIVGPTTSTNSNVTSDTHQRAALHPPTTPQDKSTDPVPLKGNNGLRTTSSRDHTLINKKTRCQDHNDNSCSNVTDTNQSTSPHRTIFLQGSATREHETNKNANIDSNKNVNSVQHGRLGVGSATTESNDAVVDRKLRTTERGAAFSVRNLIASDIDDDATCSSPTSVNALQLPLTTPSPSLRSRRCDGGRSLTSSVAPEVTSSSDERRSPVTVAEPVSGHDVISGSA